MSERSWRKFLFMVFLVIAILIAPSLITTAVTDNFYGAPDLAVTELSIVPTRDGLEGTLRIKNLGLSSAVEVQVIVMDREEDAETNESIVVAFPLLPLGPGKEFVKEFKWVPESAGTHIITTVVDSEGDEEERHERNNVRSLTVSLPFIGSVTSQRDGVLDREILGDYISGIENRVELNIGFEDVGDPSLIRVYAMVEGQFQEYGTRTAGSQFVASFDAGSLPVGDHLLVINSTYCGNPLPQRTYIVRIVPVPTWFGDLDRRHSYFDRDLLSYVLTGKIDIPTSVIRTSADGIGDLEEMTLNGGDGEVQLTGYILMDGTTTITARTDMMMEGPLTSSYSFPAIQEGKVFLPSPEAVFSMELNGSSGVELDLSSLALGRKLSVGGPYGDTIDLPLPVLTLMGEVTASSTLSVAEDGHIAPMVSRIEMDLRGNTTEMLSLDLPGYDDPCIAMSMDAYLACVLKYTGSNWSGSGDLDLSTEVHMTDLGLDMGPASLEWVPEPFGVGTAISLSPYGEIGRLELSVRDGHTTHIIYGNSTFESEVYRNNTYKSHPSLGHLQDGSPVAVWAETGYMEGLADRASSMRLYYKLGNTNGSFPGDPVRISTEEFMDQYPALASDHQRNRLGLVFIRDMDGDIYTIGDRELMASFFDGSAWSVPERVTTDTRNDREPDAWFDDEGALHVVWISEGGLGMYSSWSQGSGWSPASTIDIGGGRSVEEISFAKAQGEDPMVLLVSSGHGLPYVLSVGSPTTTPSELVNITSSGHHIGASGLVKGPDGSFDALWRQWSSRGGDLFSSTNPDMSKFRDYTIPLRLTSVEGLELSPVLYRKEDSTFDLGFIEVPLWDGNTSMTPSPVFTNRNLSWGGEVVYFSVSDPSASPGTMIMAAATVEYRGMTSSGMVRVDLYRILRDRNSGGLSQEFWESELVEFHRLGQAEQVVFTALVKEFQLGFLAVTVPTLSGVPAQTSQRFSGLPSLPDLEIISMEAARGAKTSASAVVEVSVRNWGTVAAGSRTLRVLGSTPSAPVMFKNGSLEPLFLRERSPDLELNSTVVDIPAGATVTIEMNISLSPGANHIWSRIEGPSWLPISESLDHSVLLSFPVLDLMYDPLPAVMEAGSEVRVVASAVNSGPWPLNVSYGHLMEPLPEGLEERPPEMGITLFASFRGMEVYMNHTPLEGDDERNGSLTVNWTFDTANVSGRLYMVMTLESTHASIQTKSLHGNILLLIEPEVVIGGFQQTIVGDRFTGSIDVLVHNLSPNDAEVVHLTLFNGYPSDNVVLSELLVIDLASGETRTVTMDLGLEQGLYVLSLTVEIFTVPAKGTGERWALTDSVTGDLHVKEPGPLDLTVNDDVDMGEVTSAGIISASVIMFVLVVASFFYRREHGDEDEEKD
ncbi:MAG: CARDB domain-containing protein [Thermoplasmatota archaeon]